MSKPASSIRAIAFGALTTFFANAVSSILGPPILFAFFRSARSESDSTADYVSISDYVDSLFWPVIVYSLLCTLLAFGVGGYVASRTAPKKPVLHSVVASLLAIAGLWVAASYSGEFDIELLLGFSIVGIFAGAVGGLLVRNRTAHEVVV